MINLFPNLKSEYFNQKKGAATLFIAITLITLSTLIIIFAANSGIIQDKMAGNINRSKQAYEAAEAGLEYGINYLQQNSTTILQNPTGGYIQPYTSANTTNVTMANGSQYTIVYTNPVANDYTLIQITSTGTSNDTSATRTVSQQVKFGSMLLNSPSATLISKGTVSLSSNATITNSNSSTSVSAGGSISISGNGHTSTASGGSSAGNIRSDIQANNTTISSQSTSDFFTSYFGVPPNIIKANSAHYYNNSGNTNYSSSLQGLSGTSIWIDQTSGSAIINGTTTIGSTNNPVLLIINGDINISGNLTIYGLVYVMGDATSTTDLTGNVTVVGALISANDANIAGNTSLVKNDSVLSNLQSQSSMRYYAKVAGSWKDF